MGVFFDWTGGGGGGGLMDKLLLVLLTKNTMDIYWAPKKLKSSLLYHFMKCDYMAFLHF